MMLLDTNIVSSFLKPNAETRFPAVDRFVRELLKDRDLCISYMTQFELRRGIEELVRKKQGLTQQVRLLKFLGRCQVLGLDVGGGAGWNYAAELWATLKTHSPSILLSDADLLIAATARVHGRTLVTSDKKLAKHLQAIGFAGVQVVAER